VGLASPPGGTILPSRWDYPPLSAGLASPLCRTGLPFCRTSLPFLWGSPPLSAGLASPPCGTSLPSLWD